MSSYPPQYAYPSAPPLYRPIPKPPRLHWGWVLGLVLITRGLFSPIWLLVQAYWVKKVLGKSRAFIWAIVYLASLPILFVSGMLLGVLSVVQHIPVQSIVASLTVISGVTLIVLYLVTVFTLKRELEAEPIGMSLSGGATFFLGPIYFQYHLRDYVNPQAANDGSIGLGLNAAQTKPIALGVPVEGQYLPDMQTAPNANSQS